MTGLLRRGSAASLLALGLCLLCLSACSDTDKPVNEPAKQDTRAQEEPVATSVAPLTLSGITATKVGNYRLTSGTYSLGSSTNYRAGNYSSADYRRGYAVFDLTGVNGTIVSATVRFANASNSGSVQTFSLLPVSTSNIASLGNATSTSTLYNDLGDSGSTAAAYYSATLSSVSANPEPNTTGFALGGTAVNDLTNAKNTSPYLFAVGLMYYEGGTSNRWVFDNDNTGAILYLTVNNRSAGQTCGANSDCQSNVCVSGYCCTGSCPGTNGTAACAMGTGTCSVTCNSGYGDCNGNAGDGCEVNTNTSTSHCGACGAACTNTNASGSTCSSGTCSFTCNSNFANCNGVGSDGCEVNTNTNISNCGACGAACTATNASSASCSSGTCNLTCNSGYSNCNGVGSDGCEINTTSNASNCSACGTVCSSSHIASPTCASSVCNGTCGSGFADCNSNKQSDGCETNTNTTSNCGGCGTSCSNNHIATPTCPAGACNGTCNSGFADCNSNKQSDGCETNTNTTSNCGGCGNVCSSNNIATPTCPAGACNGTCNSGFADCNSNKLSDGCEINTNTSASNCGGCGTVCSSSNIATPTCGSGVCNGTCNSGFADCNSNKQSDGCETNTNTSASNCGGCGITCQTNAGTTANTCSSGTCTPSCAAGYLDCDGNPKNGCEKQINTVSSCGTSCSTTNCDDGNACTADQCIAGACTHPGGNTGTSCRAVAGSCDVAESCPSAIPASNVNASAYSDYASAPSWSCSVSTALSAAVTNATTTMPVGSTTGFTASGAIIVDSEIMFVTGSTANSFTVTRGQLGTLAVSHNNSAPVGGVTVIDSTGSGSSCAAVARDTCGGSIALSTCTNGVGQLDSTGPNVMVVRLRGLSLSNYHVIKLTGDKPIVFLVGGNVALDTGARIDASAMGTTAGPGGNGTLCGSSTGGNGSISTTGGGGGGFGTAGGTGARLSTNPVGAAGVASSDTNLQPLRGGCGGGVGGNGSAGNGAPGAGGGAFQISASGTITVGTSSNVAILTAAGGGGLPSTSNNIGSGGGGSGGGILLESPATASFGSSGAARVHGGAAGAPRSSATGTAGESGHPLDNTRAVGGVAGSGAVDGATGGLCAGNSCASSSGTGTNGTASANVGAGGGGGGGRVVVQTASSGSGVGASACPTDAFVSSSTVCRSAVAGGCDVAENCTGSSAACPTDLFQPSTTQCRAMSGACDVAENCTGSSNACPSDGFVSSGTTCRSSVGVCDPVAEACTGTSAACPGDSYAANTVVCRSAATTCDVAEKCTGSSTSCPADAYASSSTVCRSSTGTCDPAENCTGSSTTCPSDLLTASGTQCRASAGTCDVAESCTGSSAACPTDAFLPSTTMCRNQGGSACDAVDFCTGSAAACPDGFAAQGSDCAYATNSTTIWSSGAAAGNVDRTSSDWSSSSATEIAAASAPGNWGSNVMRYVTTSSSANSSDRYLYTRLANSTLNPSSSDYIEYDVYLDDNVAGLGGIDVRYSSSSNYRNSTFYDQNGIAFHPSSDISGRAYHTWYHRRFSIPSGSTINYVDVASERDTASATSTAYYDNITYTKQPGACDGAGVCKLKDGVSCSGNSDCAGGLCAGNSCLTPAPNGTTCTANYQCVSGFCTDSVCCNSACGSGSTDCLGCSTATGSTADGLCATAAAGTVCRALANACDIVETCDGTSTACPADTTM